MRRSQWVKRELLINYVDFQRGLFCKLAYEATTGTACDCHQAKRTDSLVKVENSHAVPVVAS